MPTTHRPPATPTYILRHISAAAYSSRPTGQFTLNRDFNMHVISARRPAAGSRALAVVDVDAGGLRVFNIEIIRAADGRLRAWAPRYRGEHVAAFTPEIADKIGRVALAALEGGAKHASR